LKSELIGWMLKGDKPLCRCAASPLKGS